MIKKRLHLCCYELFTYLTEWAMGEGLGIKKGYCSNETLQYSLLAAKEAF